jgi:hypothetical protein
MQADRNVTQKEAEKKLKYSSLYIEIQRMGNRKCMIIPAVIGATGMVTRGLRKNVEVIPGKYSIDSLQKAAVLGTSHVMRKVLQCEPCGLSGGDRCWVKRRTGEKWPVTKRRRRRRRRRRQQQQHNNNNNKKKKCNGSQYIPLCCICLAVSVKASHLLIFSIFRVLHNPMRNSNRT